MSHPQPPFGPYDPNQQPSEPPTQPFPTAPMPSVPGNPYAPQPTDPYAPPPTDPYAPPPTEPFAPLPPASGAPYPPPAAPAYPPVSGAPQAGYSPQPPTSGAPYPQAGQFPPPSGPYPPAPGLPFAPPPAKKSGKKVWVIIGVIAVVLLLLCCGGVAVALYSGVTRTQDAVKSVPTPAISYDTGDGTPTSAPPNTPEPRTTDGETFNMKPGDTLIINDDDGTIEITVSNFRTKSKSCQQFMPGPKNGVFLIADVTAEVTKGTGSINPFFFRWIAADGTEENGIGGAFSGCGKLMGSGNSLPTGSKRSGQLIFDVKDMNGTLEYEHNLRTAGSWKP